MLPFYPGSAATNGIQAAPGGQACCRRAQAMTGQDPGKCVSDSVPSGLRPTPAQPVCAPAAEPGSPVASQSRHHTGGMTSANVGPGGAPDGASPWPLLAEPATSAPSGDVLRRWRADGRPFLAVVLLLHPAGELTSRIAAVARALHPWCLPSAPGQPHVTLAALGTDAAAARRVQAVLRQAAPAEVVVGGADSFGAAAFLHAGGPDLPWLRGAVLDAAGSEAAAPDAWVPHVSVGTYRWPMARRHLSARLAPWRGCSPVVARGRPVVLMVDRGSRYGRLLRVPPSPHHW